MVGFGPEDDHFAVELTYNYGIKSYKRGNDFQVVWHSLLGSVPALSCADPTIAVASMCVCRVCQFSQRELLRVQRSSTGRCCR